MKSPIAHWELMVGDVPRAKAFYAHVLGWTYSPEEGEYTMIDTGRPPLGGMMAQPPGAPAALNVYFEVADLDRTLHDAVEAGAKVIVPKRPIPPGWFAMFVDPDGIPIGIMQMRAPTA